MWRKLFNRKNRREIFVYWDGVRERRIDPLLAWRYMWANPHCQPDKDFPGAMGFTAEGNPHPYEPESESRVLAMIHEMFNVEQFSDATPGLTINESVDLLFSYLQYMTELKKKQSTSRTPPEFSGPESSGPSTTPPESESSSTPNESKSDESI